MVEKVSKRTLLCVEVLEERNVLSATGLLDFCEPSPEAATSYLVASEGVDEPVDDSGEIWIDKGEGSEMPLIYCGFPVSDEVVAYEKPYFGDDGSEEWIDDWSGEEGVFTDDMIWTFGSETGDGSELSPDLYCGFPIWEGSDGNEVCVKPYILVDGSEEWVDDWSGEDGIFTDDMMWTFGPWDETGEWVDDPTIYYLMNDVEILNFVDVPVDGEVPFDPSIIYATGVVDDPGLGGEVIYDAEILYFVSDGGDVPTEEVSLAPANATEDAASTGVIEVIQPNSFAPTKTSAGVAQDEEDSDWDGGSSTANRDEAEQTADLTDSTDPLF